MAAIAGLTITKMFSEYTVGCIAARSLINDASVELSDMLAAGNVVSMRLIKCAGEGQFRLIIDEQAAAVPVQLPLPMLELGACPKQSS